jgi:hypothetical protein
MFAVINGSILLFLFQMHCLFFYLWFLHELFVQHKRTTGLDKTALASPNQCMTIQIPAAQFCPFFEQNCAAGMSSKNRSPVF